MTGCEHVRPDLGGYVLDALEPAEAEAVRVHLAACVHCAAEHARLADLPALLGLADATGGEPVTPPPALEERLLDTVARQRRAAPRPRGARSRRLRGRPARLAALAAAVTAIALAALAIALSGGDDPGARRYELTLRPVGASAASGRAELEAVSGGTTVHLWVRGLPADPGAVYEVLCEAPRWSASAGTFRTDTRGRAYVILTTAARRGEYDSIRIVRRERGLTTPVLAAPLA